MPFQGYRLRLLEMLEDLLGWLEQGVFPVFVLDGQTVLLDDTFALRPDLRPRVETLIRQGKIKVGPWYTMPDLFLARPESLIRNLQRGLTMADDCGGGSRVGYVPDSFGHFAQLPQILSGFGIESFLFMRGMPEELRDSQGALFTWRAPDGSEVLATYLREGYFPLGALGQESFHGRYDGLQADLTAAEKRLSDTLARLIPVQKNSVCVLPAGGDHLPARADLPVVIEHLNQHQADIQLRFGTFEDYLAEVKAEENHLPVYSGDLLGQADHPLLRNVLSSRVDLKILNHQAQSLLIGVVEPLLVWSRLHKLPEVHSSLLQTAWDALLKNHAHDDICGCSVDDVHLDNTQRYHEILALCREIITRQLEHAVQNVWGGAPHSRSARVVVFNPHPWPQKTPVRARILLPDDGGEFSPESHAMELQAQSSSGDLIPVQVLSTRCKDIRNNYLETTWGRSYEVIFEAQLPAAGFDIFSFVETTQPLKALHAAQPSVVPDELLKAFTVELDADLGDGYSFGPCPEVPTSVAQLISAHRDPQQSNLYHLKYEISGHAFVRRDALKDQPLQACLGPVAKMAIDVQARERTGVQSLLGSHASQWELSLKYNNLFSDSRLRIIFAQPETVTAVLSDAQALWQEHAPAAAQSEIWPGPLAEPRYPGEKPYPVHHTNDGVVSLSPMGSRFCGGVGLHEFEVVRSGAGIAIALTLHRAVGSLSVRGGRIRSCQAGPQRATPNAQLQCDLQHTLTFGQISSDEPARAFRALKQTLHPLWAQELPVVPAKKGVGGVLSQSLCDVANTPLQLLACRPAPSGEGFFVRFLNPTNTTVHTSLRWHPSVHSAQEYQLDDSTPHAKAAEQIINQTQKTTFKPFEIKTWKILPC